MSRQLVGAPLENDARQKKSNVRFSLTHEQAHMGTHTQLRINHRWGGEGSFLHPYKNGKDLIG